MKYTMNDVKNTYENTVSGVKGIIENTKNITVHPKIDASLRIRKCQKEVFGSDLYFNKEISLFKIIAAGVCIITAFAIASAIISSLFNCDCCDKNEAE